MSELTIESLSGGKDAVLAGMQTHPAFARAKNSPDQAMKVAASYVEQKCITDVAEAVHTALVEAYETHTMLYGDADTITDDNADDWHSACDDAVDVALQPWAGILSANWLGQKTVDTRLHEEDAIEDLAKSAGVEAFKQMANGRKPGQLLAAIGIVKSDIEAIIGSGTAPTLDAGDVNDATIEALCELLDGADMLGIEIDPLSAYDELDLMSDTDDGLAHGAAERLGGIPAHCEVMRNFRAVHGTEAVGRLADMLADLKENRNAYTDVEGTGALEIPAFLVRTVEGDAAAAAQKAADATPPEARAKKAAAAKPAPAPSAEAGDALPAEVLSLLKNHANVKDKDVAEKLGISRATFNNKVNGKGDPITDPEQKAAIREVLMEHCNGLVRAINLLDGTAE